MTTTTPSSPQKWTFEAALAVYQQPFNDLLFEAATIHRQHFSHTEIQRSQLLSIKTGGCAEDCKYCSQSASWESGLKASKLMEVEAVVDAAKVAKEGGAERFCMGAAWRNPKERDMPALTQMVERVKALGLETCMTLGMLDDGQVKALEEAGLDYYNHNVDTSPEFYDQIITTRTYQDRLDTLDRVAQSKINVCSGGIVGMGETTEDRVSMLVTLANLDEPPQSVPINQLIAIDGTPMEGLARLDPIEFVRTIATARILLPTSYVRLSAGRTDMSDEMQALCFFAGANSMFWGDQLLTTANPEENSDLALLRRLGMAA